MISLSKWAERRRHRRGLNPRFNDHYFAIGFLFILSCAVSFSAILWVIIQLALSAVQ